LRFGLTELRKSCAQIKSSNPKKRSQKNGVRNIKSSRAIYREEHDDRSVFFIDQLAAGTWEIRFGREPQPSAISARCL